MGPGVASLGGEQGPRDAFAGLSGGMDVRHPRQQFDRIVLHRAAPPIPVQLVSSGRVAFVSAHQGRGGRSGRHENSLAPRTRTRPAFAS
jgi:hypothetical protein